MTAAANLTAALEGFTTAVLTAGPFLFAGVVILLGLILAYGLGRR